MKSTMVQNGADYARETLIECYYRGNPRARYWIEELAKSSGVQLEEYINH